MNDFATAIGLVLVIEGLLYSALPSVARRMAGEVSQMSEAVLRRVGLIVLIVGVAIVWLVRG